MKAPLAAPLDVAASVGISLSFARKKSGYTIPKRRALTTTPREIHQRKPVLPFTRDLPTGLFAAASLALAVYSALPGYQSGLAARIDDSLFHATARLLPLATQRAAAELQLVTLPDAMRRARQPSAATTAALDRLFGALAQHGAAAIGVTADLDALLWRAADVGELLPPAADRRSVARQLAPYRQLEAALSERPVAWLAAPSRFAAAALPVEREFRWPLLYSAHDRMLRYAFDAGSPTPASLLERRDGNWQTGFELTLLAGLDAAPALRWQIPDTLHLGHRQFTASALGAIRPWPQQEAIAALRARAIGPDAVSAGSRGRVAVLGFAGEPRADTALTRLNALLTGQYSHAPWWQFAPLTALALALWGIGVYAYRRFEAGGLLLIGATMAGLPAALTLLVHSQQPLWIEGGDLIAFALADTGLLLLLCARRNWRLHARLQLDDARVELAQLHLAQSNPRAAAIQLQQTCLSGDAAELLLETGRALERQRDYAGAREAYDAIARAQPGHHRAAAALADIAELTGRFQHLGSTLALTSAPMELPALGRYELIRLLGRGAMGAVYLAHDPKIRRDVAIKTLPLQAIEEHGRDLRERFFLEAQTAGKLQHPNIVGVYDVGEEGELAYIAMDYVAGGTLADWTHADQLLELETLYALLEQVAQALAYAHKQGVVHRDIKPGNILYDPADGTVKVTDFGIARLADYSRTKTGAILGSPYYMSPEQVSGRKVGPASDIYSLGVSFYQLLCGALPFEAESLAQLAWQITNADPRSIGRFRKGLPRSATRILATALHKEPRERFADAAEMADAFAKGARALAAARRKAG